MTFPIYLSIAAILDLVETIGTRKDINNSELPYQRPDLIEVMEIETEMFILVFLKV